MTAQIIVAEGVWGPRFAELAQAWSVGRVDHAPSAHDLAGARALVVRNRTKVTRELLESAPDLQVVARAGAGLDNIDVDAADDLGVVVVAALGANAVSVAEHTVGLALAVARKTVPLDASTRAGDWNREPGHELAGGIWGLLSAGATARATARLARGLDMSVVAYDPYLDPAGAELAGTGITLHPLDDVIATADVLSVHLPATPETTHMLDAARLAKAKPNLIVVNVGRGEAVDESALADALQQGRIAGAALDVRHAEPPGPSVLDGLPNVVLTPHVAGITTQSQARIADLLCSNIEDVLAGGTATAAVTRSATPARTSA